MLGVRLMSMLGCAFSGSCANTESACSVLAQNFDQSSLAARMLADKVCDIVDHPADGSPGISFAVVHRELGAADAAETRFGGLRQLHAEQIALLRSERRPVSFTAAGGRHFL